jgi:hypothetical protein
MDTDTQERARRPRIVTTVTSLDVLVGGHPDALRSMFQRSDAANVEALLGGPEGKLHGRLLSTLPTAGAHLLLRPLIQLVSTTLMPWDGVVFDHGGNAGANIVFGRKTGRFRAERQASWLDGAPSLVLTYPKAPWLRDELRALGDGLALGLTYVSIRDTHVPVLFFGLSR